MSIKNVKQTLFEASYGIEDVGFENRLAHNIARTASFKKFYQEIPGAKLNGKKSSVKFFVYLARLSSFLEVLKNTVPFEHSKWTFWLNGKRPKFL